MQRGVVIIFILMQLLQRHVHSFRPLKMYKLQHQHFKAANEATVTNSGGIKRQLHPLFAKKKLVSDDLLASLTEDTDAAEAEGAVITEEKSSKKKNKKKKLVSDDLLASLDSDEAADSDSVTTAAADEVAEGQEEEEEEASTGKKKKKKKKKGKKKSGIDLDSMSFDQEIESIEVAEDVSEPKDVSMETKMEDVVSMDSVADTDDADKVDENETLEQKARREKPSARVRLTETSQPGVVSMGMDGVGLLYGDKTVLSDASFTVTNGERVGIVGPNGCGKSTSLKIMAGEIEPTYGEVVKSSSKLKIAFLRQEFVEGLVLENTLKEELLASFTEEMKILSNIEACEKELESTTNNPEKMEEVLQRLSKFQDEANSKGAYTLEPRVEKVMDQIGFSKDDAKALVSSFSGGWKMRIGLAKILLSDPNILFLDEPTNHMDLDSVIWLEGFLTSQNLPMVLVSHDREFLDRVCNKIVEVEEGKMVSYKGNYSKYLSQRRERLFQWKDKYDKQQRHIKDEEKWIKRHKKDEQMAQQVRSKEMALEKLLKSDEMIPPPPRDRKFRFRFPDPPRCGELVVEGEGMMHGYGEGKYKVLFQDVNFRVERGQRIGFIGPNGSGKSTMMRLIYGSEDPKKGYADFGSSSVIASYYAQNQADELNLELSVLETLQEAANSDISLTEIRTLLGQFMFKGDDVYRKVGVLSGGEKARVALCKLMLTPANLLLLDEPTNHLDITAKEVLEDALLNYPGSVLLISHDRYFMSQVVNTIFWFHDKTLERFDCDYHDYMVRMTEREGDTDAVRLLKEKIEERYVQGDKYKITNAKVVEIKDTNEKKKKKKNFGGSGVTSGNLYKGIKNAKRFAGK